MARDPNHDILFEPIEIGPKTMKNRFYQVPHCNGAGSFRPGTQAAFREVKAEGGWGGVCTEACSISPEADFSPSVLASLWDDGDIINLRHMTDGVHKWGALAGVELWHNGAGAPNLETRAVPRGPIQASSNWAIGNYSREADESDILDLQQLYVDAAKRAVQAGFDIVYVYGSHGVLPVQFLSPLTNKRTDKYGGSLENRARFWLETIEKVKTAIGHESAVAVRLSVDQVMGTEGIEAHEDGYKFVELASNSGMVDLWDLNLSTLDEWGEDAGPSRFYKANHQAPFTKHIRAVAKAPVINVGRFTSPDDMAQMIKSGQADIVGSARASVSDPFLPNKIDEGRTDDIRECIGCNICIAKWERGATLVCTQNAAANEEYRRGWHPEKFEPAENPGSVLVVGAGPAGMECARVLGLRGYEVHLCEADSEVGGHMRDVMRYPGLAEWGRVTSYREGQLNKLKNVEVHTSSRLEAEDVLTYGADKVVLSTGSFWAQDGFSHVTMSPIPGIDASTAQFLTPEQVMAGEAVGDRVVVLDADGYFTGVAMAEMMADLGKQVSIVTHFGAAAPLMEYTLEAPNLHRMMHEKNITQYGGHWVEECEPGNVVKVKLFDLLRDGSTRTTEPAAGKPPREMSSEVTIVEADTVILTTARHSNDALYQSLWQSRERWEEEEIGGIYQAGDCYAPRLIADAVFEGHRIAREFESDNPQRPLPFLRERMIWGRDNIAGAPN
jgi:dimethylamine/trimethylamine dehydrogenase